MAAANIEHEEYFDDSEHSNQVHAFKTRKRKAKSTRRWTKGGIETLVDSEFEPHGCLWDVFDVKTITTEMNDKRCMKNYKACWV